MVNKLHCSLVTMVSVIALESAYATNNSDLMDVDDGAPPLTGNPLRNSSNEYNQDEGLDKLVSVMRENIAPLIPNLATSQYAQNFFEDMLQRAAEAELSRALGRSTSSQDDMETEVADFANQEGISNSEDQSPLTEMPTNASDLSQDKTLQTPPSLFEDMEDEAESEGEYEELDEDGFDPQLMYVVDGLDEEDDDEDAMPAPTLLEGLIKSISDEKRLIVMETCGQHFSDLNDFGLGCAALKFLSMVNPARVAFTNQMLKDAFGSKLKSENRLLAAENLVLLPQEEQQELVTLVKDLYHLISSPKGYTSRVDTLLTLCAVRIEERRALVDTVRPFIQTNTQPRDVNYLVETVASLPSHVWQKCLELTKPYIESGMKLELLTDLFEGFNNVSPETYAETEGQEEDYLDMLGLKKDRQSDKGRKKRKLREDATIDYASAMVRTYLCDIPQNRRSYVKSAVQSLMVSNTADLGYLTRFLGCLSMLSFDEDGEIPEMVHGLFKNYLSQNDASKSPTAKEKRDVSDNQRSSIEEDGSPFEYNEPEDASSELELIRFCGKNLLVRDLIVEALEALIMVPAGEFRQKVRDLYRRGLEDRTFDAEGHDSFWQYLIEKEPNLTPQLYAYWRAKMASGFGTLRTKIADNVLNNLDILHLSLDHPLVQEILGLIASDPHFLQMEAEYYAYHELVKKSRSPIDWNRVSVRSEAISDTEDYSWQVSVVPSFLSHLVSDELLLGVREEVAPKVPKDFFENFAAEIKMRTDINAAIDVEIKSMTGQTLETLFSGALGSDYLPNLLSIDPEHGRIPLRSAKLRAIVASILDQSDEVGEGRLISAREEQFLKVLARIQLCTTGKNDALEAVYNTLEPKFKLPLKNMESQQSAVSSFVADVIQRQIEHQLSGDNSMFLEGMRLWNPAELIEPVHQGLYLKNLIGPDVGLVHSMTYDEYIIRVVDPHLRLLSKTEAVDLFYRHFSPAALIAELQQAVKRSMSDTDSDVNYMNLQELMEPWCYLQGEDAEGLDGENINFWKAKLWDINQDPIQLTQLGAAVLLKALGALELVRVSSVH